MSSTLAVLLVVRLDFIRTFHQEDGLKARKFLCGFSWGDIALICPIVMWFWKNEVPIPIDHY